MFPVAEIRVKQIIKICRLYYFDNLSQQQIADRVGISRPQVSRLLTQARQAGIVNISIRNPYSAEQAFEKKLIDRFSLIDAIVVDSDSKTAGDSLSAISVNLSDLLKRLIHDRDIIGVAAGNTLNILSENIKAIERQELRVVPLIGGMGPDGTRWQANRIARNLAERWECQYYQLNAPAFVTSRAACDVLMAEPMIVNVCQLARKAAVALIGIGQLDASSTIIGSGLLCESDIAELASRGAVASLCGSFLDKDGNCVEFSGNERVIGISVNDLRSIPQVIAVAIGTAKVKAILSVLRGRWVNYLATDLETARELLRCAGPDQA